MKFAVLGAGGVGGLLGALLARAGDSVVILHDGAPRDIRVESGTFGDFTAEVETSPMLSEPVDAVLVTVKATQLDEALRRVPGEALGDAVVIPFLNGLEHVEHLRSTYGSHVVAATIAVESTKVQPGFIRHTSPFTLIQMTGAEPVAARLKAAGPDVRMRDNELAMLWDKFSILAPMALLTTHERASVGAIRERRREDLIALIDEYATVAAAADGVTIDRAAVLGRVDSMQPQMETSMQRDQAAGRPLEIDALGGALLRRAAKANVDTPVTKRLVEEIQSRAGASKSV